MLPPGFHNKRRYGFWGYRVGTENLVLIRREMGVAPVPLASGDALCKRLLPARIPPEHPEKVSCTHNAPCKRTIPAQDVRYSTSLFQDTPLGLRLTARPELRCVERACGIAVRFEAV